MKRTIHLMMMIEEGGQRKRKIRKRSEYILNQVHLIRKRRENILNQVQLIRKRSENILNQVHLIKKGSENILNQVHLTILRLIGNTGAGTDDVIQVHLTVQIPIGNIEVSTGIIIAVPITGIGLILCQNEIRYFLYFILYVQIENKHASG